MNQLKLKNNKFDNPIIHATMKTTIKLLLVAVAFATATNIVNAQTPYDDFAPSSKKKEMLKLPDAKFKAFNVDTTGKVRFVELDVNELILSYYGANDTVVNSVQLKPSDLKWWSVDPRAEKYPGWSPYNYVMGNPIMNIDPNGDTVRVYTETSGAGHAWISVGEGADMTVFSFGRYAGTYEEWHGINTLSNGPGVLLKLQGADAIAYNTAKQNSTGMNVYQVLDVTDEAVFKNLNAKFNTSTTTPDKGDYKGSPNAHVIGDYKLLSNNCTTTVSDALNQTGSDALERLPNKAGQQIHDRFIIPSSLESFLNWQSGSWLGNGSVKKQGE